VLFLRHGLNSWLLFIIYCLQLRLLYIFAVHGSLNYCHSQFWHRNTARTPQSDGGNGTHEEKEKPGRIFVASGSIPFENIMLGPADDVGASAPIRVRVVTQVEKRWRHGYDASTDVNTPATFTSRVRQYAHSSDEANGDYRGGNGLVLSTLPIVYETALYQLYSETGINSGNFLFRHMNACKTIILFCGNSFTLKEEHTLLPPME
jgi:hypothetical protein